MMSTKKLTEFKLLLLKERERILTNSRKTLENDLALNPDDLPDEADLASAEINQALIMKLRDRERILLSNIDEALERIEEGSYGICEVTEEPIEEKRLKAIPWTRVSLQGAEILEKKRKQFA